MKLWQYLKQKMLLHKDKIAFYNSKTTYSQLLDLESLEDIENGVCIAKSREMHAIEMLKKIAKGKLVVPVSNEYGLSYVDHISSFVDFGDKELDDVAFLMFTSGSTGVPKGVMLTDENIITNLENISTYFHLKPQQRICIARPLVHVAVVVGEFLYALCNGLTICFYEEAFVPRRLLSYCNDNDINILCSTPTIFSLLCKQDKENKLRLDIAVLSGEILSKEAGALLINKYSGTQFYNVYGLTEHSPRVAALSPTVFSKKPDSVGKIIGETQSKIVDGELWIKSKCVMKGYYKNAVETSKKIENGWLKTGDIVKMDDDNCLYVLGRKDNMIIRSGLNIYPEEIEQVALKCDGVKDCVAYAIKEFGMVNIGLDFVGDVNEKTLKDFMLNHLNSHAVPTRISRVESIAFLANGKKVRK